MQTDIDIHLKIFNSGGNEICHVYYDNKNCSGSHLDTDVVEVRLIV